MAIKAVTLSRALALLLFNAGLVAGNWWVQPDRASSWVAAGAFTMVMIAVLAFVHWPGARDSRREAADALQRGIVFAGFMLAIVLSMRLATSLGFAGDATTGRRLSMVVLGVFFAATGNAMPKQLSRMSSLACGAATQAFQRVAGWTWVLTGLGFSIVWLTLPLYLAQHASLAVLSLGMLIILSQLVRLLRATHSV